MPGPDLVSAAYPLTYPFRKALGLLSNASQANITVRSNAEALLGQGASDTAAALTTKVCTAIPVPVEVGDVISKVTVRSGATPSETLSHAWAAVYSGLSGNEPVLLGQSKDNAALEVKATETVTFTLEKQIEVTAAMAPNGYLYVSVMIVATKVPSLATMAGPATALTKDTTHPWFTGAPISCQTHGSALTTTAPGTIKEGSLQAAVPLVYLV